MAKKFMCLCLGILALAATFHLGARYGSASIVDHSTTGIVADGFHSMYGYCVLLDNGEFWRAEISDSPGCIHLSVYDLPMPATQVKFWPAPTHFYTLDSDLWVYNTGGWQYYGSPPGIGIQPTTWGQIKAECGE